MGGPLPPSPLPSNLSGWNSKDTRGPLGTLPLCLQGCLGPAEGGPFRALPWRRDRWTIQGFAMEEGYVDHSGLYHGGGIGGPFRALPRRRDRWTIQGFAMEEG